MDAVRPDGAVRRLGVSAMPLSDHTSRVIGRVFHFQDLTELRRMEVAVQRSERLASIGRLAAGKLLRDPLRHAKNVSRVLVVIFHQRLVPQRAPFLGITEPLGDLILNVEVQSVGGTRGRVMKVGAKAKKNSIGPLSPLPIPRPKPISSDG